MLFPLAFNLLYPVNVRDTSEVAIETAAMDIFPTQDVLESNFDFESIDPPNPRLVMLGYDSSQFALNAGTSLIIFIVHLGLIGVYFLLEPFRLWICKGQKWLHKLQKKIRDAMLWNGMLDFLFGAQIEMQLASIV